MVEEGGRRPAGAALGAVHGHRVGPRQPGDRGGLADVPGGVQLHPDPGPWKVVAHEPDLLTQDLLGEGPRTAAAEPQRAVGAVDAVVDGVGAGQSPGGAPVDHGHPAEAGLGALADLQLEGQAARFEQWQRGRIAVDEVPDLGVGVLGALLDGHAAQAVRELVEVGPDPAEQPARAVRIDPAVAADRDDVLADHHRESEAARLAADRLAEVPARDLGGPEGGEVDRQGGAEPAHGGDQVHVAVHRLPPEVDQLLEPLRHEHRRYDARRVEQVRDGRGGRAAGAEQRPAVALRGWEGGGGASPGTLAHPVLGEGPRVQAAHGDTTPGSFGYAVACHTWSRPQM